MDDDRVAQARKTLEGCLQIRAWVESFMAMSKEQQKQCATEKVHKAFFHLFRCNNTKAFVTLTGLPHGSGKCREMWFKIKIDVLKQGLANPEQDHPLELIAGHILRVEHPDRWTQLTKEKERQAQGEKPGLFGRMADFLVRRMIAKYEKIEKKKRGGNDGSANS